MTTSNLEVKIIKNDQAADVILVGKLDGTSDYSSIPVKGINSLSLDFEGITLIDSVGVQGWTRFMASIEASVNITYKRCSVRIINQMNMFKGFCSGKTVSVESYFAPYYCASCDESSDFLVAQSHATLSATPSAPAMDCPKCKEHMEFDGVEARYFLFLKSETEEGIMDGSFAVAN